MKQIVLKTLLMIIVFSFIKSVRGQIVSSEEIKKDVVTFLTDTAYSEYYLKLKSILETDESQLTDKQYYLLYYRQSVIPAKLYPSLLLNDDRLKLVDLAERGLYKKAIALGESLIKINPLDISTLNYLAMSIDKSGGGTENKYYNRLKHLVTEIFKTGDGATPETAIKIANVDDDSFLLGFTGFQGKSKGFYEADGKRYTVWTDGLGNKMYFENVLIFSK